MAAYVTDDLTRNEQALIEQANALDDDDDDDGPLPACPLCGNKATDKWGGFDCACSDDAAPWDDAAKAAWERECDARQEYLDELAAESVEPADDE